MTAETQSVDSSVRYKYHLAPLVNLGGHGLSGPHGSYAYATVVQVAKYVY